MGRSWGREGEVGWGKDGVWLLFLSLCLPAKWLIQSWFYYSQYSVIVGPQYTDHLRSNCDQFKQAFESSCNER